MALGRQTASLQASDIKPCAACFTLRDSLVNCPFVIGQICFWMCSLGCSDGIQDKITYGSGSL